MILIIHKIVNLVTILIVSSLDPLVKPIPETVDIAIIGAGPQALTLVTHLLQKKASLRDRLVVFDRAGTWMAQWKQQFGALEIPHLRSPAVHHPDPNPYALRAFAANRPSELFPPYDLPGTQLFQGFCEDVIERWRLGDGVIGASIRDIEPIQIEGRDRFRLHIQDHPPSLARRVILATGGGPPRLPDWLAEIAPTYPPERLQHSSQIDLRTLHLGGEEILIVGSGLTSGHLALGAIRRGARVTLMARRQFYEKLFDADPGWLGPKYLKGFQAELDWGRRSQMIQEARNGGSVTPKILFKLRRLEREGKVQFLENCQITRATWNKGLWDIDCDQPQGSLPSFDRLWLATGTDFDIRKHPLLQQVQRRYPLETVGGLPQLDEHLRWGKSQLFLMGPGTALQVGPVARNIYGGKLASQRIVPALTKSSLARVA